MTDSPDMAGKPFIFLRLHVTSNPWLLSEKMWDLKKCMKGGYKGGGRAFLTGGKQANFSKQKTCKKRILYTVSNWSTASIIKWLFQSAARDHDSNPFLYHLVLELVFVFVL